MVGHGGSSTGSYLADPTSPIPSHCASIVATSTLRVNKEFYHYVHLFTLIYSFVHVYLECISLLVSRFPKLQDPGCRAHMKSIGWAT